MLRLIDELRRAKEPDVLQAIAFLESTGIRFNSVLEEVMDVVLEAIRKSEGEWDGGEGSERMDEGLNGGRMNERVDERLNEGMNEQLNEGMNERLNEGMNERLNERMDERLNERLNERMDERMDERMNEGMNERLNERLNERMNNWDHMNEIDPLNEVNNRRNDLNDELNEIDPLNERMNQSPSVNPLYPLDDWNHRNDQEEEEALTQGESLNEFHHTHSIESNEQNESQQNRDQVQIQIDSADSFSSNDPLLHRPQLDSIRPMWDGSIRGIPALNAEVTEQIRGKGGSQLERRFFELLEEAQQEERFQRR